MIRKWWRRKTYKPPVAEIAIQVMTDKGWLDLMRTNTVDLGLFAKWGGYDKMNVYEEVFTEPVAFRYEIRFIADGRDFENGEDKEVREL